METPFLLFAGLTFYPSAAWDDLRGVYATLAAAHAALPLCREYGLDWYQIVDTRGVCLVEQGPLEPDHGTPFVESYREDWQTFVRRQAQAGPVC